MKLRKLFILLPLLASCVQEAGQGFSPVDFVNPLVGTQSKYSLSNGNTYPATARPWGMNFWSPQTGKSGSGWMYVYTEDKLRGFKQTHQPSPWINDYGQFSIMPVTTGPFWNEDERASWFSHKAETSTPYYYGVYLAEHDTYFEMTPTERAVSCRVTYPERELSYLVVDAFDKGSYIKVEGNRIVGYSTQNHGAVGGEAFHNWFVLESDTDFDYVRTISDGKVSEEIEASGEHTLALVGFKTSRGQQVKLKAASSFISLDQAAVNLNELDGKDFDQIKQEGKDVWNEVLGRIEVKDDDVDRLRTFYSCLYRSVLFPRDLSEVTSEGKRVHYSPYDGQVHEGYLFGDTGFWDTFRCLFPLLNLVYPEQNVKMQEGLVNDWKESGFLPEWSSPGHRNCMIGQNSASVVADAYLCGLRGYDAEALWKAVTNGANALLEKTSSGRVGFEEYNTLGYVPCDAGFRESAARTLEYAYDDWCIWQLGKALGKSDAETEQYKQHALNYKNIYNPQHKMMQGRNADGSFPEEFSPFKWGGDFTEGNAAQYTWSVFHDPAGLMELMGGKDEFAAQMDGLFNMPPDYDDSYYGGTIHEIREMQVVNMGNYAHGNQPVQHMIYLYDWCGQPWKAQMHVREVMDKLYSATPDGYCGDEDNGQTSAWYVFSALGFYPVCPGSGQYAIGTPLFKSATVHLPEGKELVINAPANGENRFYVNSVTLDGKAYQKNFFERAALVKGAKIEFIMSETANCERGSSDDAAPYSMSSK